MKVRCNNCMEVFDEKDIVWDGEEDVLPTLYFYKQGKIKSVNIKAIE